MFSVNSLISHFVGANAKSTEDFTCVCVMSCLFLFSFFAQRTFFLSFLNPIAWFVGVLTTLAAATKRINIS